LNSSESHWRKKTPAFPDGRQEKKGGGRLTSTKEKSEKKEKVASVSAPHHKFEYCPFDQAHEGRKGKGKRVLERARREGRRGEKG